MEIVLPFNELSGRLQDRRILRNLQNVAHHACDDSEQAMAPPPFSAPTNGLTDGFDRATDLLVLLARARDNDETA